MNTSYSMDSYRQHDLNISMRTSSGDTIKMDFANYQSSSFSQSQNKNSSETSSTFSSMQSFSFDIQTNGISKQDQKEIDAFMEIAQPFIDDFLEELKEDAPKSPVTKLAQQISDIFEPSRDRDQNHKHHVKSNIVDMFDRSIDKMYKKLDKSIDKIDKAIETLKDPIKAESFDLEKMMDKISKDTQKLLEKTLKDFDKINENFYA